MQMQLRRMLRAGHWQNREAGYLMEAGAFSRPARTLSLSKKHPSKCIPLYYFRFISTTFSIILFFHWIITNFWYDANVHRSYRASAASEDGQLGGVSVAMRSSSESGPGEF